MLQLVIGNKNYSSWSLRAWLALKQAGLEFSEVRIPLYQPETRQQLHQYYPSSGKVPVLFQFLSQTLIWESIAICEFAAEFNPALWPENPAVRALARSVSAEMHAGFGALRTYMPMDCRNRRSVEISPAVQQDIDRITTIWHICRQQFGTRGNFLFGEFTIADAMYAPVVSRFITYGVQLDPIAQAYIDAVWALPALQSWLADAEAETETISDSVLFPA